MSEAAQKRTRSESDSTNIALPDKKVRLDGEQVGVPLKTPNDTSSDLQIHVTEDLQKEIRTAYDLNLAINKLERCSWNVKSLAIGYSLCKFEEEVPPTDAQKAILQRLRSVESGVHAPYQSGNLVTGFQLRVSRPGCEFDKRITNGSKAVTEVLKSWYEKAAISGYGDVKTQETKVDDNVRNAREILPDEFSVDDELLSIICKKWAYYFVPARVRAVPYKIHVYGPDGHFKPHRDTPEKDLVGTFLVGLGDTHGNHAYEWNRPGRLCIGDDRFGATAGTWVAFHPDVPHYVSKMGQSQYRAVIAFKIFQDGNGGEEEALSKQDQYVQDMKAILDDIPVPFGITLSHQYSIGTMELNGYDAVLQAAAKGREGTTVHILPIVVEAQGYRSYDSDNEDEEGEECQANVFPFTRDHVDYVLDRRALGDSCEWLEGVKNVPFYSVDFFKSSDEWRNRKEEVNYTGNQADGEREDSLYLSFAMLVLSTDRSANALAPRERVEVPRTFIVPSGTRKIVIIMAGAPRWKTALSAALSEHERSTVIQLATIDATSIKPRVRSHIFRSFLTPSNVPSLPLILTSTDVRTPKVSQIISNPHVELAWWIEGKKEQYRISGLATVVPSRKHPLYDHFFSSGATSSGTGMGALKDESFDWEKKRQEVFRSMSNHMKASWCRPVPGSPLEGGEDEAKKWPETVEEPKEGEEDYEKKKKNWDKALSNFALLLIDPTEVDYLEMEMAPNRRWKFVRSSEGVWSESAVVP